MYRRAVALSLLAGLLSGAQCVPLIQEPPDPSGNPVEVAAGFVAPRQNHTVAQGTRYVIEWTLGNVTDDEAVVTLLVEQRPSLEQFILEGGLRFAPGGYQETTPFETADFPPGEYVIRLQTEMNGELNQITADGRITIDAAPTFRWIAPLEDAELEPEDPNDADSQPEIALQFVAADIEGDATLELMIDTDTNHESGNETLIESRDVGTSDEIISFTWTGDDDSGSAVDAGKYRVFARVDDSVNDPLVVECPGRITVPETPETIALEITDPNEDVTYMDDSDPLRITATLDENDDVLLDFKLDQDQNHTNGNELTILFQTLVEEDQHRKSFFWRGRDSDGDRVPNGIYTLYMAVNRGPSPPQNVEADALIFRRSDDEDLPLVGALLPATNQTITASGALVSIQWRDDDPTEDATVRITVDDDDTPDETTETDDPELEVLSGREADGDGVQDSFNWQVPDTLDPGTYFVFIYIDQDGAAPWDNVSICGGRVIIDDPTDNP